MEKITEYTLATANQDNIGALVKIVNDQIQQGYQPLGSVFVVMIGQTASVYQPMVKHHDQWDDIPRDF